MNFRQFLEYDEDQLADVVGGSLAQIFLRGTRGNHYNMDVISPLLDNLGRWLLKELSRMPQVDPDSFRDSVEHYMKIAWAPNALRKDDENKLIPKLGTWGSHSQIVDNWLRSIAHYAA